MRAYRIRAYSLAVGALAGAAVCAGCAEQPAKPAASPTTTPLPAAPAADEGHTIFSGSVISAAGVIPGVQWSCTVTAQDGSVYDSSGEVKLWSLKSGADIDQLFASGALGIGRLQPDGSCEFRLNLEFPTPCSYQALNSQNTP